MVQQLINNLLALIKWLWVVVVHYCCGVDVLMRSLSFKFLLSFIPLTWSWSWDDVNETSTKHKTEQTTYFMHYFDQMSCRIRFAHFLQKVLLKVDEVKKLFCKLINIPFIKWKTSIENLFDEKHPRWKCIWLHVFALTLNAVWGNRLGFVCLM